MTLSKADIARVRALAEKATPKCLGDWYRMLVSLNSTGLMGQEQADFVAACDPSTFSRILDAAERGAEVTDAIRERDRLYCESILATMDSSGQRLMCDVENMLHHFNSHRPDQTDALTRPTVSDGEKG